VDTIAHSSERDRADLMREAGAVKGMAPAVVEKDFWVCWVLDKLFGSVAISHKILFKGGTSLSKVFGLIERFAEDVDLILDWREVSRRVSERLSPPGNSARGWPARFLGSER
jgi:predicted nucleotidyltransferase component of viral defense system